MQLYIPLYAMQGLRSTMVLSFSSCLMVPEQEERQETPSNFRIHPKPMQDFPREPVHVGHKSARPLKR